MSGVPATYAVSNAACLMASRRLPPRRTQVRPRERDAGRANSRRVRRDLLGRLPQMDAGARVANDQVLMLLVSMCVLNEGFRLAA